MGDWWQCCYIYSTGGQCCYIFCAVWEQFWFNLGSFSDIFSVARIIISGKFEKFVNDELEGIWKEVTVANLNVLSLNFLGQTRGNDGYTYNCEENNLPPAWGVAMTISCACTLWSTDGCEAVTVIRLGPNQPQCEWRYCCSKWWMDHFHQWNRTNWCV
jgi:hypothetical protein